MFVSDAKKAMMLWLGRCGEHETREIRFDIGHWQSTLGPGHADLLYTPPGSQAAYPCPVIQESGTVRWMISRNETAEPGKGTCELTYRVGDRILASRLYVTQVDPSLLAGETQPAPDVPVPWIQQVLEAGQAAREALDSSEAVLDAARFARDCVAAYGRWIRLKVEEDGHLWACCSEETENISFSMTEEGRLEVCYQ